jgi:hypothetical protein
MQDRTFQDLRNISLYRTQRSRPNEKVSHLNTINDYLTAYRISHWGSEYGGTEGHEDGEGSSELHGTFN